MKAKITISNVLSFIIGHIRYKLFYSKYKFLLRKHIRQQIEFRIKYMDQECYQNGSCKFCGCTTTALQMANKACDKPCYPEMMDKTNWKAFVLGYIVKDKNGCWFKDTEGLYLKPKGKVNYKKV